MLNITLHSQRDGMSVVSFSLTFLYDLAMLFEKLVEQHGVHRVVANGVDFALGVTHHQVGVHLFHILSHQPKLRAARRINLLLLAEGDRLECQDRFASFVHGLAAGRRISRDVFEGTET